MSSTELLDAASISMTSSDVALAIATHDSQTPHGSVVGPFTQFSDAARIFAIDVLPVPREPDEQVRVVDLALLDRVAQRAHDVLLPDHVGEGPRAVAAVERGAGGHGRPSLVIGSARSLGAPSWRSPPRLWRSPRSAAFCAIGEPLNNYDTAHALLWGRDLAGGHSPDLEWALAPTPHPLATLAGLVLALPGARRPAVLGFRGLGDDGRRVLLARAARRHSCSRSGARGSAPRRAWWRP